MSKPTLSIAFSNNNLTQDIQAVDGIAALIGTGFTTGNLNKIIRVTSLQEAILLGITQQAEPYAFRHVAEFYNELAGNQELLIMLVSSNVTMAEMLNVNSVEYANKLMAFGKGKISKLGVFRQPPPIYNAGNKFFDIDVENALLASKNFVLAQHTKQRFFRVLIEGRINNEASTDIYNAKTANNGFAGVIVGGTANDKSASVGLALGRAVKYACHIKLGKVANGATSASRIFVGTKELGEEGGLTIPAVTEAPATATLTITNIGVDGKWMWIYAQTPNGGWMWLGNYQKVSGDATPTAVATAFQNNINLNTSSTGYSATRVGAVITIVSPAGLGASNNGLQILPNGEGGGNFSFSTTPFTGGVTARAAQLFSSDIFHDNGYITFMTYPNKAGFYFGIDNMATTDDFRILAHGAVVDACAKICALVYTEELESEVDTNADGNMQSVDAAYLETKMKQQVQVSLGDRISGFEAKVDTTVNIINTSKTKVKMKVLPKGYNTYIECEIGLTAGN